MEKLNCAKYSIDEFNKYMKFFNDNPNLSISTMTIICKINVIFNIKNISTFLSLNKHDTIGVGYGNPDNKVTNRRLYPGDYRKNKKKKSKKSFQNQTTVDCLAKNNVINIKFFANGSIQMTGCKKVDELFEVLQNIFIKLSKETLYMNYNDKKIEKVYFVDDISKLSIENISQFKIVMINCIFNINFHIDRDVLVSVLKENNYECEFDPVIHSHVSIKLKKNIDDIDDVDDDDKYISIFCFEKGSITITGSATFQRIIEIYNEINVFFLKNFLRIVKFDINNYLRTVSNI